MKQDTKKNSIKKPCAKTPFQKNYTKTRYSSKLRKLDIEKRLFWGTETFHKIDRLFLKMFDYSDNRER